VLDEHLALIPAETRNLLAVATVLGREVEISDVAALVGESDDVVEEAFRRASAAGLLEPIAGSRDRYAMTHVLLRDRLYAELPVSRRSALHWRAGEHMIARSDVVGAAGHLLDGVHAGEPARAATIARRAATVAMARFAFEDASDLASRALDALAGADSESELVCELEILRAEARIRIGDARGKEDCVRAASLARAAGSASLEARAALAYGA